MWPPSCPLTGQQVSNFGAETASVCASHVMLADHKRAG